jgi:hypothetical protein
MDDLAQRIARFVADPADGDFDELAAEAFAFQVERVAPIRRLAEARGVTPGAGLDWRRIPAVPTAAYKTLRVTVAGEEEGHGAAGPAAEGGAAGEGGAVRRTGAASEGSATSEGAGEGTAGDGGGTAETVETFRSSGTIGGEGARSVHVHPFPDLYRATVDAAFPRFCLPRGLAAGERPPMLALVPRREERPDSSLSFMVDHVLARWGGEASAWGLGPRGVDARAARSWLGARQRERRPVLVLATALALADLVAGLERLDLRFRLPAGSVVFETGGFKGREREVSPEELAAGVAERLGVPAAAVVREYGMTELTSQLYTGALAGGDPELYVPPHQVRVRAVDPESLEEVPTGESGLIAIFDLANLSSAVHVLTEDLGRLEAGGLRLLGRAPGADLRGCSLTVEELAAG